MNVAQTIRNANSHIKEVGRAEYFSVAISLPANGKARTVEKRNIHFMNVMTEYFAITGLNIPK